MARLSNVRNIQVEFHSVKQCQVQSLRSDAFQKPCSLPSLVEASFT
jgi:hypothetical protein